MMGQHEGQGELFSYQVNLERRVRADHPLRAIRAAIDFTFVRQEVAQFYGRNGNESVDPVVIMKLMFVLFFDNVRSERELMRMLPERLDYLWFLGFGLDEQIPDHSVLSKARARWGQAVFESLFVRTVQQCVAAGLVDGAKLHVDGSLVNAQASRDSVVKGSPELIAALKQAYAVQVGKLDGHIGNAHYQPSNARLCSTTDPDAPCVRHPASGSRPRYKHHRAVDDRCGVVTAVLTTPADIAEATQTTSLVQQHEEHTGQTAEVVVGDRGYGTAANYRALQQRGIVTHIAPINQRVANELFAPERFRYDSAEDLYHCPAGRTLSRRRFDVLRQVWTYTASARLCAQCPLRSQCTRGSHGRSLHRHLDHDLIERAKQQGLSSQARSSRARRQHLAEVSFAHAANHHGFKRSRWRRLWRQQIQDWLIAACQNLKLLLRHRPQGSAPAHSFAFLPPALTSLRRRLSFSFSLLLNTVALPGHPSTT